MQRAPSKKGKILMHPSRRQRPSRQLEFFPRTCSSSNIVVVSSVTPLTSCGGRIKASEKKVQRASERDSYRQLFHAIPHRGWSRLGFSITVNAVARTEIDLRDMSGELFEGFLLIFRERWGWGRVRKFGCFSLWLIDPGG